ncbi:hypothetical protein AAY473_040140 [Plecturocebus cupreus]
MLRTGKRRAGAPAKQLRRPKESRWRPVCLLCRESPVLEPEKSNIKVVAALVVWVCEIWTQEIGLFGSLFFVLFIVSLCRPGCSAVARSRLTVTSAFRKSSLTTRANAAKEKTTQGEKILKDAHTTKLLRL